MRAVLSMPRFVFDGQEDSKSAQELALPIAMALRTEYVLSHHFLSGRILEVFVSGTRHNLHVWGVSPVPYCFRERVAVDPSGVLRGVDGSRE